MMLAVSETGSGIDCARIQPHTRFVWVKDFAGDKARLESLLSSEERARAERFVFARDRDRFVVRRGLLRRMLADQVGCGPADLEFACEGDGKPRLALKGSIRNVHFNMSHSDGLIAYVLSPWFPVGIDVERVKPITDWRALATENFSEREQGELFSLPAAAQLEAFYRGWTRKEALLKAMARGIGEGLLRVEVSLAAGKGCCVHAIDGSKELADSWTLVEGSAPLGYVAAIGVKRER